MTSGSEVAVLASGVGLFLLDQWTKRMAQYRRVDASAGGNSFPRFRRVAHREDVYERDGARVLLVLLWLAALAASIILSRTGGWLHNPISGFGLALTLGGAAGNLADVLRWRYVLDFVDFGWWPVFNLADVGIVVGLLLVFCNVF
jgi:hypothetical protein